MARVEAPLQKAKAFKMKPVGGKHAQHEPCLRDQGIMVSNWAALQSTQGRIHPA